MEDIFIEKIKYEYPDGIKILDTDSVRIGAGNLVLLCGRTGSGKTTFLRLLKKKIGNDAGLVMQNPVAQIVCESVRDELAFGITNTGKEPAEIEAGVAETAAYFGITKWMNRKTFNLSGGEQQILNLASVMAMNPNVLLLDEPTSMLDPVMASRLLNIVKNINREYGITVVISEHRPELIYGEADQVLLIEDGQLIDKTPGDMAEYMGKDKELSMFLPAAARIFPEVSPSLLTIGAGKKYAEGIKMTEKAIPEYIHSEDKALEFRNVSFTYDKNTVPIIQDMNFKLYKGEIYALLGENGSGKTTAAYLASGQIKPYEGQIRVMGHNIKHCRNTVGMLMQDVTCHFMDDQLEEPYEGRHPYDLSGGEQQLAALNIVMKSNPEVLILDEPTKGLDPVWRGKFIEQIRKLARSGISILMVTHDVEMAAEVADRMSMMYDGKLVNQGTPHEFMKNNIFYTTGASRVFKGIAHICTVNEAINCKGVTN